MPAQATGILSRFQGEIRMVFSIIKAGSYQTIPNVTSSAKCHKLLFLDYFDKFGPNDCLKNSVCFGVVLVLFHNHLKKRLFCEQQ